MRITTKIMNKLDAAFNDAMEKMYEDGFDFSDLDDSEFANIMDAFLNEKKLVIKRCYIRMYLNAHKKFRKDISRHELSSDDFSQWEIQKTVMGIMNHKIKQSEKKKEVKKNRFPIESPEMPIEEDYVRRID